MTGPRLGQAQETEQGALTSRAGGSIRDCTPPSTSPCARPSRRFAGVFVAGAGSGCAAGTRQSGRSHRGEHHAHPMPC